MLLCRVTGSTVTTVRSAGIGGRVLLVVRPEGDDSASSFVAVDIVGAGRGDLVLVAKGSAARVPEAAASVPTDATIVGIIDEASHDPGG